MITGLYLTDTHDRGRNPGARIDDYHRAILLKIREAIDTAIANDVDFIVHGGDWFDTPRVAYSLYNQHQRILRRAKKKGIDVYVVPGNHDLYGYSMDTIDQTAIGALVQSGLVKLLTRKKHYVYDDVDFKLALHGREYDKDIDKDPVNDYYIDKKGDYDLLFSHGMLLEKPFHPDVRYSLTKDIVTDADVVLNGHFHPGYKLHEENDTMFGNPGSTGRDEGNTDNMTRMPKYAMIYVDKDGIDIEYVEYKVAKKGKDVFDRTQLIQKKTHTRYLEAFEQTIEDALAFEAFDPKDILAKTTGIDAKLLSDATMAIVAQEKLAQDSKLDGFIEKQKAIGIKTIELTNFQSHKKTKVELNEKGLNAITGASDSGKSAIIRALRWVFYNDPKGSDFIRHGETRATVTVVFTDGSSITRSRTKSSAGEYIVRDPNGKETEFKGFGSNLPIDIANTHQMPKVELSTGVERPLNFSYQLDGHFLLGESPATRANTIGRLTGVHVVDAAIKEKAREIRQYTVSTNAVEKQIGELDTELANFQHLDDTEKHLNILRGLITTAGNLDDELTDIAYLYDQYTKKTNEVLDLKSELKPYKNIDRGLSLINQAEQLHREISELTQLQKDTKRTKNTIADIKLDLMDYEDLDKGLDLMTKAETELQNLRELKDLYHNAVDADATEIELQIAVEKYDQLHHIDIPAMESLHQEIDELDSLHHEWYKADFDCSQLVKEAVDNQSIILNLEAKVAKLFAQSGNKCPVCLQDVSGEAISEILAHLS